MRPHLSFRRRKRGWTGYVEFSSSETGTLDQGKPGLWQAFVNLFPVLNPSRLDVYQQRLPRGSLEEVTPHFVKRIGVVVSENRGGRKFTRDGRRPLPLPCLEGLFAPLQIAL